ncbi:hypothetical protein SEA_WOFFORD_214 [Streptomyces phage Wofford]|uniref:Uncharacterized protein n=1 Tax=Streptomyces phage Wofford TaxID=2283267 RepID=A0A345MA33_9CAUD|nr:hypothetical protein HWB78_gp101 [Streptomyces phage Wollford]AXH67354.1 hypothetical protein SEA_WOFFORD_214 [Streptomyces phage Wollford]
MVYLRVGGWAMVVEDHWIGPVNYKNKYGRVVMMTRKKIVIDFPGHKQFEDIPRIKVVAYQPPNKEIT